MEKSKDTRISREQLYEEVWAEPMTTVALKYKVSSSFLARICTRLTWQTPCICPLKDGVIPSSWRRMAKICIATKLSNVKKEGDAMKNKCSSEIPNMPTGCAPDNRRPEKICGTCRYFNPEFPVNGKPAPVCLAIKEMKGGTEYSNPRGTQHYFRCSNGRYEIGISN